MAEQDLFAPLLRGVSLIFQSIRTVSWPWGTVRVAASRPHPDRIGPMREVATRLIGVLRRGSIHVCLAFVVLTLLIVFLLGSFTSPSPSSLSRPAMRETNRPSEVHR